MDLVDVLHPFALLALDIVEGLDHCGDEQLYHTHPLLAGLVTDLHFCPQNLVLFYSSLSESITKWTDIVFVLWVQIVVLGDGALDALGELP